jgi:predicted TIM-barrel fold metal-dependent hydrolase
VREDLELMQGAIDFYIHSAPSLFPRLVDDIEAAEGGRKMGLKAVVLKEHHGYTSDRMYFVRKLVSGIEVYGGVVLNNAVGGINPFAVEAAIDLGAKIVWFPTLSAKNHLDQMGAPDFGDSLKQKTKRRITEKPIYILNDKGHLIPEVYEVINLIAEHDIVLATGHLSIPEAKHLIKAAKERRVKRLYVNHPEYIINGTIEDQKELANIGAFIEHLAIFMYPMWPTKAGINGIVEMINAVGPERTVLATDLGQVHNPPPWEGLRMFIRVLLEKGISKESLRKMVQENPAYLLNIQ